MEKNRVELRNKKYLRCNFEGLISDPVVMRKTRRNEGFAAHRQLEQLLSLDPQNECQTEIINKFEPIGLNNDKIIFLINKISLLIQYADLRHNCLQLLGNLTSTSNFSCSYLFESKLFTTITNFLASCESELIENSLMCIGNIILGIDLTLSSVSSFNIVHLISSYLSGDFEKPDEAIKTSLWCVWCLIYKNLTSPNDLEIVSSLFVGLFEFDDFRTDLLKIALSLSTWHPKPEVLKKLAFCICSQELYQKEHKFYQILILKNLKEITECKEISLKVVSGLLLEDDELKKAAYGYLNAGDFEVLASELCFVVLEDCCSFDAELRNSACWALREIAKNMEQGQILKAFDGQSLRKLAQVLKEIEGEVAINLVEVCRIVLISGAVNDIVESGCMESLSVLFYQNNQNLSSLIEEIFREHLNNL